MKLYQKGLADSDEWVRRGTSSSLGALASINPDLYVEFLQKGLADSDSDILRGTASSLGAYFEKIIQREIIVKNYLLFKRSLIKKKINPIETIFIL